MFLKLTDKLPLSIKPLDAFGNAAKVDGLASWALSDATLGTLEVAADALSAVFTPAGKTGTLQVQVKADADLGAGVREILGSLDIEILAGEAVTLAIIAGEATPIVVAPPVEEPAPVVEEPVVVAPIEEAPVQ